MIDRLEEVLAQLEDDEEQKESVWTETGEVALLSGRKRRSAAEDGGTQDRAETDGTEDDTGERLARALGMLNRLERSGGSAGLAEQGSARERRGLPEMSLASAANVDPDGAASSSAASRSTAVDGLYRQLARATQWGGETAALRQTTAAETESGAGLTVEELDRAVRRDSRRYDGGLDIL